jgi:hypothetical protein
MSALERCRSEFDSRSSTRTFDPKLTSARIPKSQQLQQYWWLSSNLLIAARTLSASSSELKIRLLLHFGHVALPLTMKRMAVRPSTGSYRGSGRTRGPQEG